MSIHSAMLDRLSALSGALECPPLHVEDGRVMFGLDDDMGAVIFLENDDEGNDVMIACVVVGRPDENDAELLHDILSANYMWAFSGDGTLAIDASSNLLVVHRVMEADLSPEGFVDRFSSLVGAARYWRPRLSKAESYNLQPEFMTMLRV
ncbi:MAG: CesT family type III secretion system chaperone [Mailhella sp.]